MFKMKTNFDVTDQLKLNKFLLRFEVLMVTSMKMSVFWGSQLDID
jgi:hypothetical protein